MRIFLFLIVFLTAIPAAHAQQEQSEELHGPPDNKPPGLVVLELFSSQACIFCPKADGLFGDLVQIGNIAGLACHVDYFDVEKGSLAKSFCSQRQDYYQARLRGGPNYTPQMIINGRYDVVGYRFEDVSKTIREAAADGIKPIAIAAAENPHEFDLTLPEVESSKLEIWVALQDKPHNLTIAEGGNRGQKVVYRNIASALERHSEWDGKAGRLRLDLKLGEKHQGFIVIAQDGSSGHILAAGQYTAPASEKPAPMKTP